MPEKKIIGKRIPLWSGNEFTVKELHFDRIHIVDSSLVQTKCGIELNAGDGVFDGITTDEAYRLCPGCMVAALFSAMENIEAITSRLWHRY